MNSTNPEEHEFQPDEKSAAPDSTPDPKSGQPAAATPADRFRESLQSKRSDDDDELEEDLWEGAYSSKAMLGNWILASVISLVLFVVVLLWARAHWQCWAGWAGVCVVMWGGMWCYMMYRKLTCKYKLTSQRFIHQAGILKRVTDRIEVIDIDDVACEQRVIERIAGVGSIRIDSSDKSHPQLWMHGIEEVKEVAGLIDDTRRKERRRRGVHIEAI